MRADRLRRLALATLAALALLAAFAPAAVHAEADNVLCGSALPPDGTPPRYSILAGSVAMSSATGWPPRGTPDWFDLPILLPAAGTPVASAVADLDGDGRADLALTTSGADSLTLFLAPGSPEDMIRRGVRLPGLPFEVAAGDLDGDGRPDLVCSLWDRGAVAVLRNAGAGLFPTVDVVPVADQPRGVVLADLDADGDLDLAVASFTMNAVYVLLNRGDGTFGPSAEHVTGSGPMMLRAADIDGDGLSDLVSADAGCTTISCLLNQGGGMFAPRISTRILTTPYGIAAGDLDADGHQDLVLSGSDRGAILWGDGSGRFALDPGTALPGGYASAGVDLADMSGDGKLDIVLIDSWGCGYGRSCFDLVRIWRNDGARGFDAGPAYRTVFESQTARVADMDADGRPDVVCVGSRASEAYPSGVAIHLARGDGTLGGMQNLELAGPFENKSFKRLEGVMLRADGLMDVVVEQHQGYTISDVLLCRNQEPLGFAPPVVVAPGRIASVADLDRDGVSDLVTFRGDTLEVRLGRLTRDFGDPVATLRGLFMGAGDFDGDARTDLLLRDSLLAAYVARGLGDGTFAAPSPTGVTLPGARWFFDQGLSGVCAVLDIDRDGIEDFVANFQSGDPPYVASAAEGARESFFYWPDSLALYLSTGDGRFEFLAAHLIPLSPDVPGPTYTRVMRMFATDLDRDGWKDVLVMSGSGRGAFASSFLSRPGGALQLVPGPICGGYEASDMTVGDYDLDGILDAIASDEMTDDPGLLYFLRGRGDGSFDATLDWEFGDYLSSVATGRFDADAAPDIVFVNERMNSLGFLFNSRHAGLPTPALASLVSAAFGDGVAHVVWHVSGAATATIQRSDDGSTWAARAQAAPDGDGRVRFDDPDVLPGRRYGWRLALIEGGMTVTTAETWLDIPALPALALAGAVPNPVEGDLTVAFTLPARDEATLGLFDLAGRRLASREVGALGAGSHRIRLAESASLKPGLYFVRLTTRERTLVARAVVTR